MHVYARNHFHHHQHAVPQNKTKSPQNTKTTIITSISQIAPFDQAFKSVGPITPINKLGFSRSNNSRFLSFFSVPVPGARL